MITEIPVYIFPLILVAALLYSAVGHGGASGYLALMALVGVSMSAAKPVALILNCIVSIIAFIQYYRSGYFNFRLFLLLALASVPCAYIGSLIVIEDIWYRRILGIILLFTSLRFLFPFNEKEFIQPPHFLVLMVAGAGIGFLSGLIGIGGGIILTPLLLLLGWSKIKEAAAVSALFIFVNSVSGLAGQFQKGIDLHPNLYLMIAFATTGGLIGSFYGAKKWNVPLLRKVLSAVLMIAAIKLLLDWIFIWLHPN